MDAGLKLWGIMTATVMVLSNDSPTLVKAAARLAKVVFHDRIQICDGVDDNVQELAALNALPIGGGAIYHTEGAYNFSAQVSRDVDNVIVSGMGRATRFNYNGADPIFSVRCEQYWTFKDLDSDAGGIATGGKLINVYKEGYPVPEPSTDWIDYSGNPVIDGVFYDITVRFVPSINKYRLWGSDSTRSHTLLYDSPDGITWTSRGTVQISTGGDLTGSFNNVHLIGSTYYMIISRGGNLYIGTLSTDGLTFTDANSGNPIVSKDAAIPWEANIGGIYNSDFAFDGTIWYVLYESWGVDINIYPNSIGLASGATLAALTKYANNPVITGKAQRPLASAPEIHKVDGTDKYFVMYVESTPTEAFSEVPQYSVTQDFISYDKSKCKTPIVIPGVPVATDFTLDSLPSGSPKTKLWYYTSTLKTNMVSIDLSLLDLISFDKSTYDSYLAQDNSEAFGYSQRYNFIRNSGFEVPPPDGVWESSDATQAIETTIVKYGRVSRKVTSTSNNGGIRQYFTAADYTPYLKGKTFTFGAWVYVPTSNTSNGIMRIQSEDQPYSTLGRVDCWQWVTVSHTFGSPLDDFVVSFYLPTAGDVLYVNQAMLIEGTEIIPYYPHYSSPDIAIAGAINHSDLFMDVLAVSANHIVAAQALGADPTVCAIAAQPDVPRTLSWAITHPTLTAFTLEFVGVNAKGQTVTETYNEPSWTGETNNAFATVTSITMKDMTGNTSADSINVGITDVLGLSNIIYATGDVYKIKKNNANVVVAGAQVDTTYGTYDMAVIGLAFGDDFTIWFRSNLNIIS